MSGSLFLAYLFRFWFCFFCFFFFNFFFLPGRDGGVGNGRLCSGGGTVSAGSGVRRGGVTCCGGSLTQITGLNTTDICFFGCFFFLFLKCFFLVLLLFLNSCFCVDGEEQKGGGRGGQGEGETCTASDLNG